MVSYKNRVLRNIQADDRMGVSYKIARIAKQILAVVPEDVLFDSFLK